MSSNPILAYWYFHLPNYVLAALMYTMLGRLVLSFAFAADSQNYIWRAFVTITDPVLRLVRLATPSAVPYLVALLFGFLWLMLARLAWFLLLGALGALPRTAGAG